MTDDRDQQKHQAQLDEPREQPRQSLSDASPRTGGGIDCMDAARQLWDCLDGELTEERMRVVRAHLEACARCAPHFEFERQFLSALAATREVQPPAPADLKSRVVRALRGAGFAPG